MSTCKTCRYWIAPKPMGRSNDYRAEPLCRPLDPDTCEPMKRDFEVRICKMPTQTFAEAVIEPNGFGLIDGSEFYAALCTGESFGCVRHSPVDGPVNTVSHSTP